MDGGLAFSSSDRIRSRDRVCLLLGEEPGRHDLWNGECERGRVRAIEQGMNGWMKVE